MFEILKNNNLNNKKKNIYIYQPSGITVAVRRERATGAIVLHLILYFLPSILRVLLKPNRPSLALIKQTIEIYFHL